MKGVLVMNNLSNQFPDGTIIDDWFYDLSIPKNKKSEYIVTNYGVLDDGIIHTKELQAVIDLAYSNGGGVIVIPSGTFLTGAIHFKQGVDLYLSKDSILKGSTNLSDYSLVETRIEGETCLYYEALVNGSHLDGFTITGEGTIDGNGFPFWYAFWQRHKWNPKCTNKDEQRPRLVYLDNCSNVTFSGIHFINSPFWTTHLYRSNHVKYLNCFFFSPLTPVKAPSTDAIDIDNCSDILVKNCYIEVNDDGIALKGGKGLNAHLDSNNGPNERIIIEDIEYGFCHSCLTCGSESIFNNNIIIRRIKVHKAQNIVWLKMRPDTKQCYQNVLVSEVDGNANSFININPWTQFSVLTESKDYLISEAHNFTFENCKCKCLIFFNVKKDLAQYKLSNFTFIDIDAKTKNNSVDRSCIDNLVMQNVNFGLYE